MPRLTIDGNEIEVPKGTRIIEAAKTLNNDIPFYCYHPGLSIAGNCRMCLVEIEKMPKLQIACHMEAQDGMVVRTNTEKVLKTRQHILEFLLVNHPLDCPVCDQAGECWLQDYYMKHGLYDSRVNENKVKKEKALSIGPTVMLDQERCILCSRCVRFTDEISKTNELGIIHRGDHAKVTVFPGKELNNPYSGNVVDICPVGALTDKDFRFKVRVWYLKAKDSVCNGCARGCNIQVHYRTDRLHHSQGGRVMRLKPRYNGEVNKWWMCDEGRYGYKYHDHNRILNPLTRLGEGNPSPQPSPQRGEGVLKSSPLPLGEGRVRDDVRMVPKEISWEEALVQAAKLIQDAGQKIGVFVSPQLSNEELFLARKIFKEHLGLQNIFLFSPSAEGFQDDFLIRSDKNPNTKGAEYLGWSVNPPAVSNFFAEAAAGNFEGAVIFGQDLIGLAGADAEKALSKLKWTLFIGTNHNVMSETSRLVLPAATHFEEHGTFTNFEGKVQRYEKALEPLGESRPAWQIVIDLAKALGIHIHYDREEEIFEDLSKSVEIFRELAYEKLGLGGSDIRVFGAPVIPALQP